MLLRLGIETCLGSYGAHNGDMFLCTRTTHLEVGVLDPLGVIHRQSGKDQHTRDRDDEAQHTGATIVRHMLSKRDDVARELIENDAYLALKAAEEIVSEIPDLVRFERALTSGGGQMAALRGVANSRNMVAVADVDIDFTKWYMNRYDSLTYTEGRITTHELAHLIHFAINSVDPGLSQRIVDAYRAAIEADLWDGRELNHYLERNSLEYWAVGTELWFNLTYVATDPEGRDNTDTRTELRERDPELYSLLAEVYPETYIPGLRRYHYPTERESTSSVTETMPPVRRPHCFQAGVHYH